MRRIIAAMQMSLDGYIEGADGDVSWVPGWDDPFGVVPDVDAFILGGGMYPGYEAFWTHVHERPEEMSPVSGRPASETERAYARVALESPHVVLSTRLTSVSWPNTRIVRDLSEIATLKDARGGSMHAVGGASLVSSLLSAGLVDELRLVVQPVLLAAGKALFADLRTQQALRLREVTSLELGQVRLNYELA